MIGSMGTVFAASAEAHRLTLVWRDTRGFTTLGIPPRNAWQPLPPTSPDLT